MIKAIVQYRRQVFTIAFIIVTVFTLVKCTGNEKPATETGDETPAPAIFEEKRKVFAGSASCASCHKNIYDTHLHTAHFLTSQPADATTIKGSFEKGKNKFSFSDVAYVAMEKRDSGYYQVAYQDGAETKHRRFDIVVGSGTKGQTYINWVDNKPYQLPITYFTSAHQWSNSPGYPDRIVFNRPITSRCLECHATYAWRTTPYNREPEEFDRKSIIYGVDCERCHGPSAEHVAWQQKNPKDTIGKYVINPANFTRQQSLDLCALCHGGRLNKSKPSFSFESGDRLPDYFNLDTVGRNIADIDVHGNQYGLLSASKCFTMSQMTCGSCHDTHKNEAKQLAVYSQRCMNCHSEAHGKICKMTAKLGKSIQKNCIDCHMPEQSSKAIAVLLQGATMPTSATMRTHLIKIYPEETQKSLISIGKLMSPARHLN